MVMTMVVGNPAHEVEDLIPRARASPVLSQTSTRSTSQFYRTLSHHCWMKSLRKLQPQNGLEEKGDLNGDVYSGDDGDEEW